MGVTASPDTKKHLLWCKKTTKYIDFVTPSENIARAHIAQARDSIRAMEVNRREGLADWAITASYYAKYFAVSALFAQFGIKCENHACAATLFEYLFNGIISHDKIHNFAQSKDQRIEAQYYSSAKNVNLDEVTHQTKRFVIDVEHLLDNIRSGKQQTSVIERRMNELKSW
jgi:uncharacterized protein (UPF0332 family)